MKGLPLWKVFANEAAKKKRKAKSKRGGPRPGSGRPRGRVKPETTTIRVPLDVAAEWRTTRSLVKQHKPSDSELAFMLTQLQPRIEL